MNERDSETIAGLLEQMGYARAGDAGEADVVVINTCSVRENADNHFFGLLGQTKHVKAKRPGTIVAVCGCMMQQAHIVEKIEGKYGWGDLIFGTHNIDRLPELIDEVLASRRAQISHGLRLGGRNDNSSGGRNDKSSRRNGRVHVRPSVAVEKERAGIIEGLPAKRESAVRAYVNIMYGCNNFCTYCIVPYTRGREVSRTPESILAEVRDLAASGTKEITLLGQNVNSYAGVYSDGTSSIALPGADTGLDFAGLLERIDRDPDTAGIRRVRFMTSHPKDLSDRLIACFDKNTGPEKLCPSIHLPVQAGSDSVLGRMNRRYTKEGYIDLAAKLRAANPDIVLTTDFIVGFPGETEDDFMETMDLIERVRFDSAFTFIFSPRVGTPAAGYECQVPEADKHARFNRMVELLNAISAEKNQTYIGKVFEVLIDGPAKEGDAMLTGRTPGGKLVNFPAPAEADPFARVLITAANTFSLIGKIINK
jgi:tRNA-2-methylthio-N6-dimethylallyladenosine synthase